MITNHPEFALAIAMDRHRKLLAEADHHRLVRLVKKTAIDHGQRPATTATESPELREAKKRIRLLEQENVVLRRAAA